MANYTSISNKIYEIEDLSPNEKYHLMVLHRFYNENKGYAYPSVKQIMKLCNSKNELQTRKILSRLEEKGYIKIEAKVGVGSKFYLLKNFISTYKENDSIATINNDRTVEFDSTIENDRFTTYKNDSKRLSKLIDNNNYTNNNTIINTKTTNHTYKNLSNLDVKYIKLTDQEYDKLEKEFGKRLLEEKIITMDGFEANRKKKYKDYYRALRGWLSKEKIKIPPTYKPNTFMGLELA